MQDALGAGQSDGAAISEAFVNARRQAHALSGYPGALPKSFADAYAIQTRAITLWPDDIAGWKIGMTAPAFRERAESERLCGPIFQKSVQWANDAQLSAPVYEGGFAAVEAECIYRLGRSVAPGACAATPEAVMDVIDTLHVGVEIASSPFSGINELGPEVTISDFGNNAGLIIGREVKEWRSLDYNALYAEVSINGASVGLASAASILNGPLSAIAFLVGVCATRGIALEEGSWITTGAITGVHEVSVGDRAHVDFGDFGAIDVEFSKAKPAV